MSCRGGSGSGSSRRRGEWRDYKEQNGCATTTSSEFSIDQNLLVDPKLLFIGNKIGEGAHGSVYEGRYGDRVVSIKVLHRGSTTDQRESLEARFAREVNMMSRVKHDNLVKLLELVKIH